VATTSTTALRITTQSPTGQYQPTRLPCLDASLASVTNNSSYQAAACNHCTCCGCGALLALTLSSCYGLAMTIISELNRKVVEGTLASLILLARFCGLSVLQSFAQILTTTHSFAKNVSGENLCLLHSAMLLRPRVTAVDCSDPVAARCGS